jgi:hypothetical protein
MSNCVGCVAWQRRAEIDRLKRMKAKVDAECFRQAKEIYGFLDKHKTKEKEKQA